jgi:flagellar biosynthetic protein FlhB
MLFSAFLIFSVFSTYMGDISLRGLRVYLEQASDFDMSGGAVHDILLDGLYLIFKILGLPMLVIIIAALIGPVSQVGFMLSSDNLAPKLERISLIKGMERLFSSKAIVEFLKGLFKIFLTGFVAFLVIWPFLANLKGYPGVDIVLSLKQFKILMVKFLIAIISVMALIAGLDYFYQRAQFMKKMMMSRQEQKEEYKQSEGDPQIKSKLRQIRQEKARQRMMSEVPNADVIINNPTHYSVAISYKAEKMQAPIVVAKGVDDIAMRIRDIAKENNIAMVENKPLARGLYASVDLGEEIPEEFYKAVAKVISYVFNLQHKKPR